MGTTSSKLKIIDEAYYQANSIEEFLKSETLILNFLSSYPDLTDLIWRLARNQFRLAKRASSDNQKTNLFTQCLKTAKKGVSIDEKSAENIYYMGLCLGNISIQKGILSSLNHRKTLKNTMEKAIAINPNVENAGPHRFLGVYYSVLPFFLDGDSEKAISNLETAVKLAPNFAENYFYLGKVYFRNGFYSKAKHVLEQFLKLANTIKNDPEMPKQMAEAQDILNEIKTSSN